MILNRTRKPVEIRVGGLFKLDLRMFAKVGTGFFKDDYQDTFQYFLSSSIIFVQAQMLSRIETWQTIFEIKFFANH